MLIDDLIQPSGWEQTLLKRFMFSGPQWGMIRSST
jgi:hypothetical protein